MTLTFNPLQAMVITYSYAKVHGQQSVGSKDRVETDRQTDGGYCITSLANAVGSNINSKVKVITIQCITFSSLQQ